MDQSFTMTQADPSRLIPLKAFERASAEKCASIANKAGSAGSSHLTFQGLKRPRLLGYSQGKAYGIENDYQKSSNTKPSATLPELNTRAVMSTTWYTSVVKDCGVVWPVFVRIKVLIS